MPKIDVFSNDEIFVSFGTKIFMPHFIVIVSEKFTPNCSSNEFVVKIEIGNYGIFSI